MDKQNVVYALTGILFSFKKGGNPVIHYTLDGHGKHYIKLNKPVIKTNYCMILLIELSKVVQFIE